MSHPQNDESLILPPGYLILTSPTHREDLTFSCPHEGCDGFVFPFAEKRIQHERDWHSGPYQCAECGAEFAAATALRRHARASQHNTEWVCQQADCQSSGMEFTSKGTYMKHVRDSIAHRGEVAEKDSDVVDSIVVASSHDDQNSITRGVNQQEDFICHEPCCHYYGTDFSCKSEWARHVKSGSHAGASAIGEATRARLPPGEALDEEQKALRSLRCSKTACPKFDDIFNTPRGFYNHLRKPEHLSGVDESVGSAEESQDKDADELLDETNLRCKEKDCPKFRHHFLSRTGYKMHINSTPHVKASGAHDAPNPTSPLSTPTGTFTTSFLSPMKIPSLPNDKTPGSPSTGRGPAMPAKTPRKDSLSRIITMRSSSAAKRERELEKRNQELEKRVERLEEQYERVRQVLERMGGLSLDE
ncbi:hypothetical protein QQZ08_006652 [Neonectria magnoliae]|uniref:C2H2-type domain-containing protein n=1 Tax=Neonectria magnoliae TaxID=2732573 RepID=A0ABR1I0P6_9HYPO